jgi:hypothetical protein
VTTTAGATKKNPAAKKSSSEDFSRLAAIRSATIFSRRKIVSEVSILFFDGKNWRRESIIGIVM